MQQKHGGTTYIAAVSQLSVINLCIVLHGKYCRNPAFRLQH